MLAAASAALPLESMRNGPISQSGGIARTTKKTRIRAAEKSRKPNRRRRRRSDSSPDPFTRLAEPAMTTGSVSMRLVGAAATTDSTGTMLVGVVVTTGSGAGLAAAEVTGGSAGAAGGMDAAACAAPPVSDCSLARAGLIGAGAAGGGVETEVAGVTSSTGGFVRLASRCCSCALSAA